MLKKGASEFFYLLLPTALVLLSLHFIFTRPEKKFYEPAVSFDLQDVKERGYLIALTDHNSFNYYVYRGRVMGFQYELLNLFSQDMGIPLRIIIDNNFDNSVYSLQNGICDLIATYITVTKQRRALFDYTEPIMQTQQVLIQRKASYLADDDTYINSVLDLAHKTVYVKTNSAYHKRLNNLAAEIGDSINIMTNEAFTTELLIRQVAMGRIDYTVADIHVARINAMYYPSLDISLPISFEQNIAWVVRKNAPVLREALNEWIAAFKKTQHYNALLHRYFGSFFQVRVSSSPFASINGNRISYYDKYLKKYSQKIDWDWRLLASLVYQESRFNPDAVSPVGAIGLMQLMPATAEKYGIDSTSTPAEHIKAGVKYLKWLDEQLLPRVVCPEERSKFVIAAYNAGLGHIIDAQELARNNNRNPGVWFNNVDYFILNKSKPEYLNDPVVRHGTLRGGETYAMTRQVWERYLHYLNLFSL